MTLRDAVGKYVAVRRLEGLAFADGEHWLVRFSSFVSDVPLSQVTTLDVINFLDSCSTTMNARRIKLHRLARFFDYWTSRGTILPILMPPDGQIRKETFLPYIYKESEIRALLCAAGQCQTAANCALEPNTLRIFLLLLYATGAAPGELRGLRRQDVLLAARFILLQNSRCGSRKIPISTELRDILKGYVNWRFKKPAAGEYLFVTKRNDKINHTQLSKTFARLYAFAGVQRSDGYSRTPRIQDFRGSFAVQRITAWIQDGSDLNRMLPALAAYMGRRSLLSGESYLRMTPERFRKQLDALSPVRAPQHWRNNQPMMGLLAEM